MFAVLLEGVGAHLSQLRVGHRVVAQVQVNHLLDHQVAGLDCEHHLSKEPGHIDSQCHVGNHFFDYVAFAFLVRGTEVGVGVGGCGWVCEGG